MKYLLTSILLFLGSLLFGQDSLIISSHPVLNDEFQICRQSKNQLLFLDSLIAKTQNEKPPSKGNGERYFRIKNEKLVILHIDAGWICRLRGNYNEAHLYLSKGEQYLDSLKLYEMYSDELKNTISTYNNIQKQICYDTYQKDTTIFYSWDCARFFPELSGEIIKADSIKEISAVDSTLNPSPPDISHYGKIYLNDTLRFDNRYVLDSISRTYFKRIEGSIKSNLGYKSFPEGMRHLAYNQSDTIVIEINIYFDTNTVSKTCNIVYSNCHELIRDYYLFYCNSVNFGLDLNYGESPYMFRGKQIKFYVPLVIKPEIPNNFNRMDRFYVNDDHYSIEYEKTKPIKLN